MMCRISSVANRQEGFSLLEILIVLVILATLVSMVRLDTGTVLTRLTEVEIEDRIQGHIRDALFESVVAPNALMIHHRIPGCQGVLRSLAGGYFVPTLFTCGGSQFRMFSSGELVRE
jgi:prepilin-type N-terminal cleavage/methylation domain-containing protein